MCPHLHGLVDVSDIFCLYVGVLLATSHQLRKGSQQTLDADSAHVHILPRDQDCRHAVTYSGHSRCQLCRVQGWPASAYVARASVVPLPVFDTIEAASTTMAAAASQLWLLGGVPKSLSQLLLAVV